MATVSRMSTGVDFKLMHYPNFKLSQCQPHKSGAGNAGGVFSERALEQPRRGVGLRGHLGPASSGDGAAKAR